MRSFILSFFHLDLAGVLRIFILKVNDYTWLRNLVGIILPQILFSYVLGSVCISQQCFVYDLAFMYGYKISTKNFCFILGRSYNLIFNRRGGIDMQVLPDSQFSPPPINIHNTVGVASQLPAFKEG